MSYSLFPCSLTLLCCGGQILKSGSGVVQNTFAGHSKAVTSLVSRSKFTVTTGEDFEIHLYPTDALMKSCERLVFVTLLSTACDKLIEQSDSTDSVDSVGARHLVVQVEQSIWCVSVCPNNNF